MSESFARSEHRRDPSLSRCSVSVVSCSQFHNRASILDPCSLKECLDFNEVTSSILRLMILAVHVVAVNVTILPTVALLA